MRLQQYITEIFDSKVKISSDVKKGEYYDYDFSINDTEYEANISVITIPNDKDFNKWVIDFQALSDTLSTTDITNTGHVFQVFAAMFKCIKDFAKREKPTSDIIMYAKIDEPSRVKLYDKLFKQKSKEFGYSLFKKEKKTNFIKYILTKI